MNGLRIFDSTFFNLNCMYCFDILLCKPIISTTVPTSRLMRIMSLCLLRGKFVQLDDFAIVFYLSITSIDPSSSFALFFSERHHVEDCRLGTPTFESLCHVQILGGSERFILPRHRNNLVVADVVVRLIYTSAEPWSALNFLQ